MCTYVCVYVCVCAYVSVCAIQYMDSKEARLQLKAQLRGHKDRVWSVAWSRQVTRQHAPLALSFPFLPTSPPSSWGLHTFPKCVRACGLTSYVV